MSPTADDLRILRTAAALADNVWKRVARWGPFARDAFGLQLVRAADSVGANIAAAVGRVDEGDRLQHLYYARGSLFETKYWLNRALARELVDAETVEAYAAELTELAGQLNALAAVTRAQRRVPAPARAVQEPEPAYFAGDAPVLTGGAGPLPGLLEAAPDLEAAPLFSAADLDHLRFSSQSHSD